MENSHLFLQERIQLKIIFFIYLEVTIIQWIFIGSTSTPNGSVLIISCNHLVSPDVKLRRMPGCSKNEKNPEEDDIIIDTIDWWLIGRKQNALKSSFYLNGKEKCRLITCIYIYLKYLIINHLTESSIHNKYISKKCNEYFSFRSYVLFFFFFSCHITHLIEYMQRTVFVLKKTYSG